MKVTRCDSPGCPVEEGVVTYTITVPGREARETDLCPEHGAQVVALHEAGRPTPRPSFTMQASGGLPTLPRR